MQEPLKVFISYSHKDKILKEKLIVHMNSLIRQKYVCLWYDNMIMPGQEIDAEVMDALRNSQIILLLLSADYLASEYCYTVEMNEALKLRQAGTMEIIPVLLRPTDLKGTPIDNLMSLPEDRKAITLFENEDAALKNVVDGIRKIVEGWYRKSIPSLSDRAAETDSEDRKKNSSVQRGNNYGFQFNGNIYGGNFEINN